MYKVFIFLFVFLEKRIGKVILSFPDTRTFKEKRPLITSPNDTFHHCPLSRCEEERGEKGGPKKIK